MILTIYVYVALLAFIFFTLSKALTYAKMPMHTRWEIYPVPKEKHREEYGGSYYEDVKWYEKPREISHAGEIKDMLGEMLFIKLLYKNQRPLWYFSFALHFGIYLLFAWTFFLIVGAITELGGTPVVADGGAWASLVYYVTLITGGIGAVLVAIGSLGLFLRRVFIESMKIYSDSQDYFNLIFIFAVVVTGLMTWAGDPGFAYGRDIFKSLFTFSAIETHPILAVHILLLGLLLLYIPQTKMSHYVGKYFSFHKVLWENDPNLPGSEIERKVKEGSSFKPKQTWSAPHWQPTQQKPKED